MANEAGVAAPGPIRELLSHVLPGQARYPRPLVMLPTSRLRPGDLSSW